MRVAIFDPCLSEIGHYRQFNRHIVKLLGSDDVEKVYMIDYAGYFERWYEDFTKSYPRNIEITEASDGIPPRQKIKGNIKNPFESFLLYIEDRRWYKKIFQKILKIGPDITLITSESHGPAMYGVFDSRINPVFLLHTPKLLLEGFDEPSQSWFFGMKRKLGKRAIQKFAKNSALSLLVLEESANEALNRNGFKPFRIPNCLFDGSNDRGDPKPARDGGFLISTVGVISVEKNVGFIIDCLKNREMPDIRYRISGFPLDEYGRRIKEEVESTKVPSIEGRFEYLTDEEYEREIKMSDFIALSYPKNRSDKASGVLFDALKHGRPVIAPDIEPFRTYVERYGIGLIFEEGNEGSFVERVNLAKRLGTSYFTKNIDDFKRDFSYDLWTKKFIGFLNSLENR